MKKSDIDILVDPGEALSFYDLADLELELRRVLECPVDVSTPGGLAARVRKTIEQESRPLF